MVEMTLGQQRPDAPVGVNEAGRNDVAAAEIADGADDFGVEILILAAVPGPEIAFGEAAVPGEIGGFRGDDVRDDIAAEFLDQSRKTIESSPYPPDSGVGGRGLTASARPIVKVVDVVTDIATMLAKARSVAGGAHFFQRPPRQADIKRGLIGVEERAAFAGVGGPLDLVVHRVSPGLSRGGDGAGRRPRGQNGRDKTVGGTLENRPPRFSIPRKSPATTIRGEAVGGLTGRAAPTGRCG